MENHVASFAKAKINIIYCSPPESKDSDLKQKASKLGECYLPLLIRADCSQSLFVSFTVKCNYQKLLLFRAVKLWLVCNSSDFPEDESNVCHYSGHMEYCPSCHTFSKTESSLLVTMALWQSIESPTLVYSVSNLMLLFCGGTPLPTPCYWAEMPGSKPSQCRLRQRKYRVALSLLSPLSVASCSIQQWANVFLSLFLVPSTPMDILPCSPNQFLFQLIMWYVTVTIGL